MPSQSPKPNDIYEGSARLYYRSIREEPDRVHPALRSKEPGRVHPALHSKAPDRQSYAQWEANVAASTLPLSGFRRKLPPFYNGPATKIPDLYPRESFENPRPAPRPDSFALVSKQARREHRAHRQHQPPPLAKYWRDKHQRPPYLDKPLPPLPYETTVFSDVLSRQDQEREREPAL